jgi:hypothetical protein
MRLRFLPLLVVLAAVLLAPATASARPASGSPAVAAKKVKACKRKHGESKKHWLKRCKCKAFKHGESRRTFKKRCPGAKVPKRQAQAPAGSTPPPGSAPAPAPAASDVDKVTAALTGKSVQYGSYSGSTGSSDFEEFRFCAGTFVYKRNRIGVSGLAYDTNGNGRWQITQAHINPDGVSGTATIHYVYDAFTSNDVDPAPPTEGDVPVGFAGSKAQIGSRVYDVVPITC